MQGETVLFGKFNRYLTPDEVDHDKFYINAPAYKKDEIVSVRIPGSSSEIKFEYI